MIVDLVVEGAERGGQGISFDGDGTGASGNYAAWSAARCEVVNGFYRCVCACGGGHDGCPLVGVGAVYWSSQLSMAAAFSRNRSTSSRIQSSSCRTPDRSSFYVVLNADSIISVNVFSTVSTRLVILSARPRIPSYSRCSLVMMARASSASSTLPVSSMTSTTSWLSF